MPTVAIVYHSQFGHTKALAEHVAKGVSSIAGVTATLMPVSDLPPPNADKSMGGRWAELNAADAMIFGTPTYMGDVSADFKKFMESSGGLWYKQVWKNKIAAGFTNSGGLSGDKLHALTTLAVFAGQHSMVWVPAGIMASTDGTNINRLGSFLGAMAQSDNGPADTATPKSDRAYFELFGAHVAQAVARWTKNA
jgi:multimeric flavodoxin WrbA